MCLNIICILYVYIHIIKTATSSSLLFILFFPLGFCFFRCFEGNRAAVVVYFLISSGNSETTTFVRHMVAAAAAAMAV